MSTTPEIPDSVWRDIETVLGAGITSAERQTAGTHNQTYRVTTRAGEWIVRLRHGPDHALKRSLAAQGAARSRGVRVPAVFAVHLEPSDADDYAWVVEEYVRGALFFPERMSRRARCLASADIGRQLRRLHSFAASGFGRLSADLTQARHPGWRDWVDEQEAGVDEAVRLAGLAPDGAARIRSAYRFLRAAYMDTPRLCHGDFADDNLLIRDGALAAVVDWELALGCDPAHDIAYWFMWHRDLECLDALLSGYQPPDPASIRGRIRAHVTVNAVKFITWFHSRGEWRDAEHCRTLLEEAGMDRDRVVRTEDARG